MRCHFWTLETEVKMPKKFDELPTVFR